MTPRSKKPESPPASQDAAAAAELFSVGHVPSVALSPEQESLFRSFQSNLVSLLSHELRTPLMGVLNALASLDDQGEPLGDLTRQDALTLARVQAVKLEAALSMALDLAAWEAGALRVDPREGDFARLAGSVFPFGEGPTSPVPALFDEARLKRAFWRLRDLLSSLGTLRSTALSGRTLEIGVELSDNAAASEWDRLWRETQVARAAHASLPLHVFAGVLQGEQEFLSRTREGLGAELHLAAQILAQHEARLEAQVASLVLTIRIELPVIEGRARVLQVIRSRIWQPGIQEPRPLALRVSASGSGEVVDAFGLADGSGRRVEIRSPEAATGEGWVRCPADGVDAAALLDRATDLALA